MAEISDTFRGDVAALSSLADEIDVEEVCGHDVATHLRAMIAATPPAPASEAPREVVLRDLLEALIKLEEAARQAQAGEMDLQSIDVDRREARAAITKARAYGKQCAEAAVKGLG